MFTVTAGGHSGKGNKVCIPIYYMIKMKAPTGASPKRRVEQSGNSISHIMKKFGGSMKENGLMH